MMAFYRSQGFFISFLGLLVLTVFFFTASFFMYPPMDGDSVVFVPPILSWIRGEGLVNNATAAVKFLDPSGFGRLVYHGFLFQMVAGLLAGVPTYAAIRQSVAWMIVFNLWMSFYLFWYPFRKNSRFLLKQGLLVFFAMTGFATWLSSPSVRPELFGVFLILTGFYLHLIIPERWHWLISGALIGLLGATHFVAAMLTFVLCCALWAVRLRWSEAFSLMALSACTALLIFAACFLFYPYSINDIVAGHARHAELSMRQWIQLEVGKRWKEYWFLNPYVFGYGILYAIAGWVGLFRVFKIRKQIKWKPGFYIFFALLSWAFVFFGIQSPKQNYNLLIFSPIVFFCLICWMENSEKGECEYPHARRRFWLVASVFIITSVGFFREALLFPYFLRYGLSYEQARAFFDNGKADCEYMILDKGLFSLTESYEGAESYTDRGMKWIERKDPDCFVRQQANRGVLKPEPFEGYNVEKNYFSETIPELFGVRLANTVRGYNFALYRKIDNTN